MVKLEHRMKTYFTRAYTSMFRNSVKRGHDKPTFSKAEFIEWLFENEFENRYCEWQESGFEKMLKPSVDRHDDYLGYSFDNMQLITIIANFQKYKPKISGKNSSNYKELVDYETISTPRNNFKAKCKKEGWNFDEFDEIYSGERRAGKDNRKKYFYIRRNYG